MTRSTRFEFHISRRARERYQFDQMLFALDGNVVLADFSAARQFAEQMSLIGGKPVPAGDINAMGLLDEIFHVLIRQYELENPGVFTRALTHLENEVGSKATLDMLHKFIAEFPPMPVYRGEMTAETYLAGQRGGVSNRASTLEELLLLQIANLNPAQGPYKELFDDSTLIANSAYPVAIKQLESYLGTQSGFGKGRESLLHTLRAPALASPDSLSGQLEYVLTRWGALIGERFILRVLRGIDFVREEIVRAGGTGGPGADIPVPTFGGMEAEVERFSPDKEWMPHLVLIAKNAYVWLDQLSRQYRQSITRLDQVPEQELQLLARRGFKGLWLIGLWERSLASKKIKQNMGDGDAVASAYSLYSYDIAADLGGWEALENLRWRAWQHGVRLAADMVPNHMGIDSKWVIEHPDWFLSLPYPPYPGYTFNGPDLSEDPRVGIFIEDHYYDRTDAAVVFKRLDRWTNDVRYIYHGNDGTSMPWNDTAQLDYHRADVREAVIQTILHVARNFPVIRFDAAMTLAKKHIQRLWFPEPGAGGAIPSRAEHGLTRAEFEAAIPREFWREVVDRVAEEVPDTLLLAEAFWLMEGYFVRTLGMHRVYNSAFMHMLRDEDNAKYRQVMKNVLEFDPRILQRFVNFMNNPDEKTAVEQFGKSDKYFGICVLLSTLPGLPMFGHGQVEGFSEKYGMEFRRAKWDEQPDEGFIRYHEQVIFPLLHRRHLFSGVDNFLLFDFFTPNGNVNEDVFAFSNRHHVERSLVVYHNRHAEARGWVRSSAAFAVPVDGDTRYIQQTLQEGLGLPDGDNDFVLFRDHMSGLEYIRPARELAERGLYIELGPYRCHVFLNFRIVTDPDGRWRSLHDALHGAGIPSLDARLAEMTSPAVPEPADEPARKKSPTRRKTTSPKGTRAKKAPAPRKRTASKKMPLETDPSDEVK